MSSHRCVARAAIAAAPSRQASGLTELRRWEPRQAIASGSEVASSNARGASVKVSSMDGGR